MLTVVTPWAGGGGGHSQRGWVALLLCIGNEHLVQVVAADGVGLARDNSSVAACLL